MTVNLKPCPFCGGFVEIRDEADGRDETYIIHCMNCYMDYSKFIWRARGKDDIAKEWNRRANE